MNVTAFLGFADDFLAAKHQAWYSSPRSWTEQQRICFAANAIRTASHEDAR